MAKAGTVSIDFAAETAKFTAELKKVRQDLSSLKSATSSIATSFKAAGAAIGAFVSVAAISSSIRAIADATAESEKAVSLLNNALAASGRNVAAVSQDFQNFASQMQRLTTFNDEAVIGVEALLLRFRGLSSGVIKQATADILDLASALGIDLDTAARSVGRALEDPVKGITALQRSGVIFSEVQRDLVKDLVKTGDLAGAQQVILAELEGRYKGAAVAARDTFGGALQGLKNAFDDLLEAKGGLPGATNALNQLAFKLSSDEFKRGFAQLTEGLIKFIDLAGRAAVATLNFLDTLGELQVRGGGKSAHELLVEELEEEQDKLQFLKIISLGFRTEEIKKEEAYIATLKQRIALLDTAVAKQKLLAGFTGAADSIIDQITTPPPPKIPKPDTSLPDPARGGQGGEFALSNIAFEFENEFEETQRQNAMLEEANLEHLGRLAMQDLDAATDRFEVQRSFLDEIIGLNEEYGIRLVTFDQWKNQTMAQNAAQLGVTLGSAAATIFGKQKEFAIAQAIISSLTGAANAFKDVPFPYNFAASAAVLAQGFALVKQIQSTNKGGGHSGGGGRGSIGAPSNPVFTDTGGEDQRFGAGQQKVVQVTVQGTVMTDVAARQFATVLGDVINDADLVFIQPNSRQGQVLREPS